MFIVKYHQDFQSELEIHKDDSFVTFNILLSDKNDFEGGGTFFYDGIISNINQGDMIVHSGKIKHSGLAITKGTRYVLVAFISVDEFS
jgi:predicted 2-oxoglutarate/Fe(II)-dependent dioxygenase YbiX